MHLIPPWVELRAADGRVARVNPRWFRDPGVAAEFFAAHTRHAALTGPASPETPCAPDT